MHPGPKITCNHKFIEIKLTREFTGYLLQVYIVQTDIQSPELKSESCAFSKATMKDGSPEAQE